jgi:GT2 family glycosyltransferase
VATVVVHRPGPWFDEVLAALADQDYPNLQVLFLLTSGEGAPELGEDESSDDELRSRILERLPGAHVRSLGANPGFAAAANEVLRLVEGESGLFCLLHDDVALEPSAIRLLVEELYRSNAGIVGPKLVDWDDPGVLQHVGFDMDRFGELDSLVEPGEVDQEQHDAVRDVFVVSSACLVVRADLFRTLGGFDRTMTFHGEDRDLCWRAHLSGARVLVVPSARARHRGRLAERRPDLAHTVLAARHRLRTVVTSTGRWRLLVVLPLLTLFALGDLVVGVATGHASRAVATLRALVGLVPRVGAISVRRRQVAPLRQVPDAEVAGLQLRGSARLTAYLRSRGSSVAVRESEGRRRRVREVGVVTIGAWLAALGLLVVGGRGLITDGVRTVGEMLPYPESVGDLLDRYRSAWWDTGLGRTAAAPTGFGVLGVAGVLVAGNMGLLRMLGVVGVIGLGYLGMWRLLGVFPRAWARAAGLAVYAAVPLPYAAAGAGRWQVLAAYTTVPWALHLVRRVGGLGDADLHEPDEISDPLVGVSNARRLRLVAALALVLALAGAFSPAVVLVALLASVVWLLAAALARGALGAALVGVAAAWVAAGVALLLHLPFAARYLDTGGWDAIVGPALAGPRDLGLVRLAYFGIGPTTLGPLAIALYVPVVVSVLVARGWRLTWAARGALLVVSFGALAVLDDVGSFPFRLPEPGIVLTPVAVGLALCAAVAVGSFGSDVRGARFGWRQPIGVVGAAAVVLGLLPGVAAAADGYWQQPAVSLADQLGELLPGADAAGDYRVLLLGDPRVMPSASWGYEDGVAYALHDDGPFGVAEAWAGPDDVERRSVGEAIDAIAARTTARAGRLLGPLGVRYVVVPLVDQVASTTTAPLPPPEGLLDALADQLDLRRTYSPTGLVVYENTSWVPVHAVLSPEAAEASDEAGAAALAQVDLGSSTPVLVGADALGASSQDLPAGVVQVGVAFDEGWRLEVGGVEVPARRTFGTTTGFDLAAPGEATLTYSQPIGRTLLVAIQLLGWAVVALVALGVPGPRRWRRRRPIPPVDEPAPVISLAESAVESHAHADRDAGGSP